MYCTTENDLVIKKTSKNVIDDNGDKEYYYEPSSNAGVLLSRNQLEH